MLILTELTFLQFYEVIQRPSYVKEGNVDPGWGDGDGVPGGFALKSKAWFTMRHKHKHKYKHKHNACSHLLHKHEESDIRKHNELQNEAVGVWDEHVFKMADDSRSPAAFAALQMPNTLLPTIFLSQLHLFLRLVNVHLPILTKRVFLFVMLKSSEPGFVVEARIIANCLGKFLVENNIFRHHFEQY